MKDFLKHSINVGDKAVYITYGCKKFTVANVIKMSSERIYFDNGHRCRSDKCIVIK